MKPLVPVVRPKGLGLGADKSILLQTSNTKQKHHSKTTQEDELVLKCGSYCMLLGGNHDGLYGTVRFSSLFLDHETDHTRIATHLILVVLVWTTSLNAEDSVISNWIRMKFGRNVLDVNLHLLT